MREPEADASSEETVEPAAQKRGSVGAGFGLALALDVVGVFVAMYPLSAVDAYGFIYALAFPGVLQVIWLAPLYFFLRQRGYSETAKGVKILGGIVFLLNTACWGVLGIGSLTGMT